MRLEVAILGDGYQAFTFDEDVFPDPQTLVQTLRKKGIHVVPIVDPGVKKDPEYTTYQEEDRHKSRCAVCMFCPTALLHTICIKIRLQRGNSGN